MPSPLILHLAAAALSSGQAAALAPLAAEASFPWSPALQAEGRAAGRALAAAARPQDPSAPPDAAPELTQALTALAAARAAAARLREMIEGLERYQSHPYARALIDPPAIWRIGRARLLDYGLTPEAQAAAPVDRPFRPVLVLPSLVNRAAILDLHPARSLLRALAASGLRPLLLDWGDPGPTERRFDLSDYHRARVLPALRVAAELAGGPVPVLGYCMGGAFAAALAAQRPGLVSHLALIGAPWDFSKLSGLSAALASLGAQEPAETLEARLKGLGETLGAVPPDHLQLLFTALDPTLALRKFRRFARLDPASLDADLFVAVEDWLNHGVALAAPAARDIALGWYRENRAARGEWRIGGEPVWPGSITAPTLAFCSRADRIAPSACAEALPRAIPGARLLRPRTGHVGMIVGSNAAREVWGPLAAFLREG